MLESHIPQKEVITISPLYRWLTIVFAIVSILMAGFILSSILGKSTIVVSPKMEQQDLPFSLSIFKKLDEIKSEQAGIVADVQEVNLEKNVVITLPKTQSTSPKASGLVTITNKSNKEQTLVASTQMLADNNKIYRLDKTVISLPGKEIQVNVTADAAGADFDIGETKLKIIKLRPDLQPLIYAAAEKINREQSGQAEVNDQTITAGLEEAKKQITQEIISELKKSGQINEKTVAVNFYRQSYDIKTINENGELAYTIGAIGRATAISNQDIATVIAQNLPSELKDKFTIVDPLNLSFKLEYSATTSQELGTINGVAKLSIANLRINKSELVGKSIDEAKKLLNDAGADNINIILPFWQNKLPRLTTNIDIQIKK